MATEHNEYMQNLNSTVSDFECELDINVDHDDFECSATSSDAIGCDNDFDNLFFVVDNNENSDSSEGENTEWYKDSWEDKIDSMEATLMDVLHDPLFESTVLRSIDEEPPITDLTEIPLLAAGNFVT